MGAADREVEALPTRNDCSQGRLVNLADLRKIGPRDSRVEAESECEGPAVFVEVCEQNALAAWSANVELLAPPCAGRKQVSLPLPSSSGRRGRAPSRVP